MVEKRRNSLYRLKDVPAGGGGSLVGEEEGGVAIELLSDDPNLTEDEFVDVRLAALKGTPLYTKMLEEARGSTKYKGNPEEYIRDWLRVAYNTGKNEIEGLKAEPKYRYKDPQDPPYPIACIMDYNQKQIVTSLMQTKHDKHKKLCGQGTKESCKKAKHYKKQL